MIILFGLALFAMTGLLVLVAMIPKEAIKEKALESAEYLYDSELFGYVTEGVEGSRIDRYADAILMDIAYHYDAEKPLQSVMLSSYYFSPCQEENESFLESVRDDVEATRQYLRYWHGSNVIVRPLLTLISVKQMYILNGAIMSLLFICFVVLAVRMRETALAVGMTASMVITGACFVPLSLEYTWTFLIMLTASIIALVFRRGKDRRWQVPFFLVVGMITAYFDFLTTETLTLLIPVLILASDNGSAVTEDKADDKLLLLKSRLHYPWDMAMKNIISWGIGYVGAWVSKWVLAAVILQVDIMPYVSEHIEERLGGELGLNLWQYLTGAVVRNILCLFPLGYGGFGVFAAFLLVIFAAYIGYVYHGKKYDKDKILLYVILGLLPYVRYLLLHNHSYIHCFFTYRAQAATVFAVVLIIGELIRKNDSRFT